MARNRGKGNEGGGGGAPAWMATFGDLMSLLLTFFVLLLSFSTIQVTDFNAAMGSLRGALGMFSDTAHKVWFITRERARPLSYHYRFVRQGRIAGYKTDQEIPLIFMKNEYRNSLTDMVEEITTFSRAQGVADLVSVDYYEKGVKIRLPSVLLFETASARLKDDPRTDAILSKVVELIENLPYGISIEGHTDDTRISTPRYASNWELSSARALSVLRYFERRGIAPERLEAVALGKERPYSDNRTLLGRKLNRRVEINLDVSRIYEK